MPFLLSAHLSTAACWVTSPWRSNWGHGAKLCLWCDLLLLHCFPRSSFNLLYLPENWQHTYFSKTKPRLNANKSTFFLYLVMWGGDVSMAPLLMQYHTHSLVLLSGFNLDMLLGSVLPWLSTAYSSVSELEMHHQSLNENLIYKFLLYSQNTQEMIDVIFVSSELVNRR